MNPKELLQSAETILVIDWPSKEVPETLVLAGLHVVVRGGPGPEDYSTYRINKNEANDGKAVAREPGRAPERADLIYSYRPLDELPEIVATAKSLGARAIWSQSGLVADGIQDAEGCWVGDEELRRARDLVESAGLQLITEPYIGDVARSLRTHHGRT